MIHLIQALAHLQPQIAYTNHAAQTVSEDARAIAMTPSSKISCYNILLPQRSNMDPTVQAALITSALSLIGTTANWIFSIANIRRDSRKYYARFLLKYKEACVDLIRLNIAVNRELARYLEFGSQPSEAECPRLREVISHRNNSRSNLLKLRTEGIILFPFKKRIINKAYSISTQGFDKEIIIIPDSPHRTGNTYETCTTWAHNFNSVFPHCDETIYSQLDRAINTYSTIKSLLMK